MFRKSSLLFLQIIAILACEQLTAHDDDKKPMTTKQIMEKAFGGKKPLMAKILSRRASQKEMDQAIRYLKAMVKNEPSSGSMKSWKEKNEKLISAAVGIKKGKEKAYEQFAKAVNCKSCHDAHQ